MKTYRLYCDESYSDKFYPFFNDFYGGVLALEADADFINKELKNLAEGLNVHGEIKWSKITQNYKDKYIEIINAFFDYVNDGRLKVRVMFTHNYRKPVGLKKEHVENKYFILYYQFIKHAFGLKYIEPKEKIRLKIFLDLLPDKKEKCELFKKYVVGLQKNHYKDICINRRRQYNRNKRSF